MVSEKHEVVYAHDNVTARFWTYVGVKSLGKAEIDIAVKDGK